MFISNINQVQATTKQLNTFNRIPHIHRKENGLICDQRLA